METIKRQCQVVILPVNVSKRYNCTEGLIVKCIKSWTPIGEDPKEINKLSVSKNWSTGVLDHYEPQHLYFTSDEETREGDYAYNEDINLVSNSFDGNPNLTCEKIIASTDTSLGLPQPSTAFIEKYISEYNKGNIIKKVMVEYEDKSSELIDSVDNLTAICTEDYDNEEESPYHHLLEKAIIELNNYSPIIKVSKGNTITISKVKDSWSREELPDVLELYLETGFISKELGYSSPKDWINKNL